MKTTYLQKFCYCLIAGLLATYVLLEISRKLITDLQLLGDVALGILIAFLLFSLVWQYRERKRQIDSSRTLAFIQGAIRYLVAIDLCTFGWNKIFHLQLAPAPQAMLDMPTSSLTGEQMAIVFFGHSYFFGLAVAGLQIIGSILLLYRRTALLGACILLPVVTNIILMDFFYEIETGVLIQAICLFAGILQIIFVERARMVELFLQAKSKLQVFQFRNSGVKHAIRFSAVLIPLALAIYASNKEKKYPALTGKYEVKHLKVNGTEIITDNCTDSILTLVYLDDNNDITMEYNSQDRRMIGDFVFDKNTKALNVKWRYPSKNLAPFTATFSASSHGEALLFSGKMGGEELWMELVRVR